MYFCLTIETKSKMVVKSAIVKPISHDHMCVELGSPLFSTGSVQTCQLGAPQIHTTPVFFIKYSLPLDHLLVLVHTLTWMVQYLLEPFHQILHFCIMLNNLSNRSETPR